MQSVWSFECHFSLYTSNVWDCEPLFKIGGRGCDSETSHTVPSSKTDNHVAEFPSGVLDSGTQLIPRVLYCLRSCLDSAATTAMTSPTSFRLRAVALIAGYFIDYGMVQIRSALA